MNQARRRAAVKDARNKILANKEVPTSLEEARVLALWEGWEHCQAEDLLSRYDILEVEKEFKLPILNSRTEPTGLEYVGIFDALACDLVSGKTVVVEHKTTSLDIESDRSDYLYQCSMSNQLTMYLCALHQLGIETDEVIFNLARKSSLRPRRITKADRDVAILEGSYYGAEPLPDTLDGIESGDLKEENPELFYYRLLWEYVSNPKKYFRKEVVTREPWQKAEWFRSLESFALQIEADVAPVKNPENCVRKGFGRCEFLDICQGLYDTESAMHLGFEHRDTTVGGSGRISHSRISCYNTCQMKHHLRYVEGLQEKGYTTPALSQGKLFHDAMDSYLAKMRRVNS